jgi:hypothetical protein
MPVFSGLTPGYLSMALLRLKPFPCKACPEAGERAKKWGMASEARHTPFLRTLSSRNWGLKEGVTDEKGVKNSIVLVSAGIDKTQSESMIMTCSTNPYR